MRKSVVRWFTPWRSPLSLIAIFSATLQAEPSPLAAMSQDDIAHGQRIFRVHCARCHGMNGEGGEGPSLTRARLKHAASDEALHQVITQGIPGTGMPNTFGPNDRELWQVTAYVKQLGELPQEPLPGDPANGRKLYETKGACGTCHISQGVGKGIGPELTGVGSRRNAGYLRRSLTNPDADFPMSTSWQTGRINTFLTVRVVAEEGEFEGMRVNEDEFSIQLRDLAGKIHSFDKRKLLSYQRAEGHSLMPGYETTLSESEVNDLVAYLMQLKGETGDDA